MPTAKAERLLNLVIALLNSPRYRTANWIHRNVAGYGDAPTEEAFFRTFERDKTELRDLGIPLQNEADGYRIPPHEFALPEMSFSAAEQVAIGLAGRLWEATALGAAGSGALRKITDAAAGTTTGTGIGMHGAAGAGSAAAGVPSLTGDRSAVGLLQPRLRSGGPAFAPLLAAVRARRAVSFSYRKRNDGGGGQSEQRTVQPWGLVSYRGRWYLVGHDSVRGARRTFRLSRITDSVRTVGRAAAYRIPGDLDLLEIVSASVEWPAQRSATLLVRADRATGLRRHGQPTVQASAAPDGWDRLELPVGSVSDAAREIAAQGPDVVVEGPPELRSAVIAVLSGSASGRPGGAGGAGPH